MIRRNAPSLRLGLLAGASVMAIVVTGSAQAQTAFGRRGATVDPAVAAAHASETAATRNVAAQAAATRTRDAFARAASVRTQMDGAQAAARAAALAGTSSVPNGLGAGGLQVASGVALDPTLWVGAAAPTQAVGTDGRTAVTIGQTQEKAILTWDSFNVGRETDLIFNQKGNQNWVALNRVTSASADPSRILGSIKADGSVYIINRNGVIFGGASQINTRSLIASSLDIHGGAIEYTRPAGVSDAAWEKLKIAARDQRFKNGILAANASDGLSAPPTFSDGDVFYSYFPNAANPQVLPGEVFAAYDGVTVEAGARITTAANGQAVLLGHNVTNHGTINATAGQVLLAAGRSVVLLDGAQRMVRSDTGSIVPAATLIPGYVALVDRGGTALNDGLITSARGNVAMTGKAVTQNGVIVVTAGVQQQGSIILDASEGNVPYGQGSELRYVGTDAVGTGVFKGTVTLGSGSYTSILPDDSGETTVGNSFKTPSVQVVGNQIVFAQGSTLWSPGATVSLRAEDFYAAAVYEPRNPTPGRIYIDAGATIDLGGLNGITLGMDQNSITAELRANELANNPVLRDGVLRGQTVYFDARLGAKLTDGTGVANLAGYYDLIERDAAQFMTIGGSLSLHGSEIITRAGSTIDLSGGSVHYDAGLVKSTNLIDAYGRIVPIEQASAGVKYLGIEGDFLVNHARWGVTDRFTSNFSRSSAGRWEAGYDEGRSAGTLKIEVGAAYIDQTDFARIFEGDVKAGVVVGEHQVDAPTGAGITNVTSIWHQRPSLGTLLMGGATTLSTLVGGNITIADLAPRLGADFTAGSALFTVTRGAGFNLDTVSQVAGVTAYDHYLPSDWFDGKTFGTVSLFSGDTTNGTYVRQSDGTLAPRPGAGLLGGVLTIGAGVTVDLGDYGAFKFVGRQAEIDGTIKAAGGSVSLETTWSPNIVSQQDNWSVVPAALRPGTHLGATGSIDVSGRWTNNYLEALQGTALTNAVVDGGKVRIASYNIDLDVGSRIAVDGGAALATDGATLTLGNGGSILLDSTVGVAQNAISATDGRLTLDGTLSGYAPGKGGTLTIDTGFNVVIANQPVLADGILGAGVAAPISLTLTKDVVIKAGQISPVPTTYQISLVPAGQVLPENSPYFSFYYDFTPTQDLTLPDGVYAYADDFNVTFSPGDTIPAGTVLMYAEGTISAGQPIPGNLFPEGIDFGTPITLVRPAGPLTEDYTIPAGYVLPSGVVFEQAVQVAAPRTFGPDFFTKGGFANFGLSGGQGLTVLSGTTVAPTVDTLALTGAVRDIATGADLTRLAQQAGSGVSLINSATLPESQRQSTSLILSTVQASATGTYESRSSVATIYNDRAHFPGNLTIDKGATITLTPKSTVVLDSRANIFVDGTIATAGGAIKVTPGDVEYNQDTTIRIGDNARLLAGGYQKTTLADGLEIRSVEAGGTITLGNASYVANGQTSNADGRAVMIGAGAVLDVSGVRGVTDLKPGSADESATGHLASPYVGVATDGAAGTILVNASTGSIAGDLRLSAGGTTGSGGSLVVVATSGSPNGIIVKQSADATLAPVTATSEIAQGGLTVLADRINASGTDALTLYTLNTPGLSFVGDTTLTAGRSINLGVKAIHRPVATAADVTIAAPYVSFGINGNGTTATDLAAPVYATNLDGRFTVNAGLIDFAAWMPFECPACTATDKGGFGLVSLNATGDIRLTPYGTSATRATAGISTGGDLRLDAAQVYVVNGLFSSATYIGQYDRVDADPGFLVRAGKSVTLTSNGAAAPVPLNFGERLTLRAPVITQAGVLRAPAGQIRLEASDTLTLAPGSLTSVSLEGLTVPFGLLNARGQFLGYGSAASTPTRAVQLNGATVTVASGASVDVSGGGDLLGWTFTSGTGGTNNILADQSANGAFAILPSLGTAPAPLHANAADGSSDTTIQSTSLTPLNDKRLKVGDSVWLNAAPGLAAGYYTLLPASYALLDGGLLIKPVGGTSAGALAPTTLDDGATIVSGYRAVTGTAIRDQAWSSYQVMDGDTWRQYSEIATYSFNTMKATQAIEAGLTVRTLTDAGGIAIKASKVLDLSGKGLFDSKGIAGTLDITAPQVALVQAGVATPTGYLAVDARQLESFGGAASILLGGTRPRTSYDATLASSGAPATYLGDTITTTASDVLVADGVRFSGAELLLNATKGVVIGTGAALTATGQANLSDAALVLSGDGALMRLSRNDRVGLVRSGGSGATGTITVRDGAVFTTPGSVSFDASAGFDLSSKAVFDVAQFDLASNAILLGAVPNGTTGTTIGLDTLARLARSSDLLLRGHQSIAFYGDVALGARDVGGVAQLGAITLDSASLNGDGGKVSITAGTLTLKNSGAAAATATAGTGALSLDVDTLALGAGSVATSGFKTVSGAAGTISTSGTGALAIGGDADLAVGRVVARTGSRYALSTTGALALRHGTAPKADATVDLGGTLALTATQIAFDTAAQARAGTLALTASAGDVTLGANAALDVSGAAIDFRDVTKFAPGGVVRLSATGGVTSAAGARIDVSGSARGGAAGVVNVTAGGAAALAGAITASALQGYAGGEFTLDAATTDFAALTEILNAGTVNGVRDMRLRAQDIVLGAGQRIEAHTVALRSDSGAVTIAGTIAAGGSASAADGGSVTLRGRSVTLAGSGRIEAGAATVGQAAYQPASGSVTIAADEGRAVLAAGSLIDVSGGREGGGRVQVRVARASGADLSGTVTGAREKALVGMAVRDSDTVDGATVLANLGGWGAAAPSGWDVGTGVLVRSAGTLTVTGTIDLGTVAGVGYLGLEAAGDLLINASISDGFASAATSATLDSGKSFGYGFRAGRDVVLAGGQLVRTGTGDIAIAAGRDLTLTNNASVIYTAGSATATDSGFDRTGYGTVKATGVRVLGEFPTLGGNVSLGAGRDITAPVVNQSASVWLYRYGTASWDGNPANSTVLQQTNWSIVYGNFQYGVGALGGGNVRVRAGGNITDLAVAIPTSAYLVTPVGSVARDADLIVRGGGNLDLRAAGDIGGGAFVLGKGRATLVAAGTVGQGKLTSVVTGNPMSTAPTLTARGLYPLFGLMDATVSVTGGRDVTVEGAYDLAMSPQICDNLVGACATTPTGYTTGSGIGSAFVGYSARTALDATSVAGTLAYVNNGWAGTSVSLRNTNTGFIIRPAQPPVGPTTPLTYYATASVSPGILRFAALNGNVLLDPTQSSTGLTLAPSPLGTLDMLAAGNVRINYDSTTKPIVLQDVGIDYIRDALTPFAANSVVSIDRYADPTQDTASSIGNNFYRGYDLLHAGDANPLHLIALTGSVGPDALAGGGYQTWGLQSPKPIDIYAGTDIIHPLLTIQNNDSRQVSSIVAGRDINLLRGSIAILGDGLLWVEAGRDYTVDKNTQISNGSGAIRSVGNASTYPILGPQSTNYALADVGADISLIAGTAQGAGQYDSFAALYLDPANLADPAFGLSHPSNAGKVVHVYDQELDAYLKLLGFADVTADTRLALFAGLPTLTRSAFVQGVLVDELRATGVDYNTVDGPRYQQYSRGYAALEALFPATADLVGTANPHGNILLDNALAESRSGGDISLLAPYGRIGLGNPLSNEGAAAAGIVTRRGGDISILANGTISLEQTRVFTLQGGNILMWTSQGDITAGVGAKTSVSNVPLSYVFDKSGFLTLNTFGLSTGAGIGVLDALEGKDDDRKRSRLDLLAFFGEVNAGDAGIRVVGDLNIAALRVVNADNIQVSGQASGIPVTQAVNIGALTAASAVAGAVTNEAARIAERARPQTVRELPTFVNVRFLGFGEF